MQDQVVSRGWPTGLCTTKTKSGPAGRRTRAALGAAQGLSLAAAPTFAIMALLPMALGGGAADVMCAGTHGASPLTGMAAMYLMMSAFHLGPWLKLFAGRGGGHHD